MADRKTHSKHLFNGIEKPDGYTLPIIVGCYIKTPENIGSIIRLADNAGCEKLLFVTNGDNVRTSKIKKTASSSFNNVSWSFCKQEDLNTQIPRGYSWVAVETASDSVNIYKTKLPQRIALFVGNEIQGIDSSILSQCSQIIHIPLFGSNTSMNVSHALAVALFEWQRQVTDL